MAGRGRDLKPNQRRRTGGDWYLRSKGTEGFYEGRTVANAPKRSRQRVDPLDLTTGRPLYVNSCRSAVVVESKWQWSARLEGRRQMKEQWHKEPGESFFPEDWSNLKIEIEEKELRNIEVVVFLLLRLSA